MCRAGVAFWSRELGWDLVCSGDALRSYRIGRPLPPLPVIRERAGVRVIWNVECRGCSKHCGSQFAPLGF